MFVFEILLVTPTVNTNSSELKIEDTTLTKIKTKPVVSINENNIKAEGKASY